VDACTILLVERDDLLRAGIAAVLTRNGFEVVPAPNALAALALVQPGGLQPDLVLLDLFLLQINGLMLLKSLRQIPALESVPAIVLSTQGFPDVIDQAISAGANDFILKPFDSQLLVEKINRALHRVSL